MKKRNVITLVLLLVLTNLITAFTVLRIGSDDLKQRAKIAWVKNYIDKNYLREVNEEDYKLGELKGIVASLKDPYSEYYSEDELKELLEFTSGVFHGIGIQVAPGEDNRITVISPIKGSPAEAAGIQAGDKIIAVDGKEYMANQMDEAVSKMRGERGTDVELSIMTEQAGEGHLRTVIVTRDEIKVDTILPHVLDDDIGYIGITQFDDGTGKDFVTALNELQAQGVKSLILDLRGNPGGVLDSAVEVSDALMSEGKIVYAKNREGKEVMSYNSDPAASNLPLVILINRGSASASEVVSGAIRDNNRGILMGETTFGKGVVQTVTKIPGGGGLKLTTSEYFSPNGVNIDGKGIEPDREVKLPDDVTGIGVEHLKEDTQLQAAIDYLKK